MISLTPRLVRQQEDFVSPFDETVPGFADYWWIDAFSDRVDQHHRPYSFFDRSGQEVARALLRQQAGFVDLEDAGVALPTDSIAVDLIEVRADIRHHQRGVGTEVVRTLERLHPADVMFAFSMEADAFWRSTGWTLAPRIEESRLFNPLYVRWR